MPPLRVLIADDTADMRLLLRTALARAGDFEVVAEAADGAEAIRASAEHQPDAVVLDLAMPVLDGLQALPEILRVSPRTKVVVMSGFDRTGLQEDARERGAAAYIEKGRPLDEVADTLRAVCLRSGREDVTSEDVEHPSPEPDIDAELLATLAHELSSPVAVINGFSTLLLRDPARLSPQDISSYANAIARAGKQLEDLINGFYDARYLAADDLRIERRRVDVANLVEETIGDLREIVAPREIHTRVLEPAEAPIDETRVRQVVATLVSNAAKFSPPDGPVRIAVRRLDRSIEVSVEDRCVGIPPEKRELLFGKFTRLRRGVPGLGLGLYVARGIARAHGGDLTYEPLEEGGCRFTMRLPREEQARG